MSVTNHHGRRILTMMRKLMLAVAAVALVACSGSKQESAAKSMVGTSKTEPVESKQAVTPNAVAYLAGGCFWGVEHYLEQLDGVASVESGYMGGKGKSPTYEQVSSAKSGHVETVRVRYDSERVSYETLAKLFFEIHDPTQANGQGPDIGPQYMSVVFYNSENEKKIATGLIDRLYKRGYKVVTRLDRAGTFWPAEQYHQNYYARTGKKPYCHARVRRFGASAR